jgi:hypothetical protein
MRTEHDGRWIVKYDPERFLRGGLVTTDDAGKARMFPTIEHARQFYLQEAKVRLPDGRPNRPLTAYAGVFELIAEIENA